MTDFHVKLGDGANFTKTVSEYDVYGFAGITGDFSPNHVNKAYMEKSSYGRLQAHGALMVGFMSTASTLAIAGTRDEDIVPAVVFAAHPADVRNVMVGGRWIVRDGAHTLLDVAAELERTVR